MNAQVWNLVVALVVGLLGVILNWRVNCWWDSHNEVPVSDRIRRFVVAFFKVATLSFVCGEVGVLLFNLFWDIIIQDIFFSICIPLVVIFAFGSAHTRMKQQETFVQMDEFARRWKSGHRL